MKTVLTCILLYLCAQPALAMQDDPTEVKDRLQDAAKVLDQLRESPDTIPATVAARTKCVAVIPSFVKGGFIVGGHPGRGVVTCRTEMGWSAPAFITISGGSWGAQIGGEEFAMILLFMSQNGVDKLMTENFKIGAEASAAAGPVGRSAEASTDFKANAEILVYSRSRGLFAGLELSGAIVKADKSSTQAFYGQQIKSRDLLSGHNISSEVFDPFRSAVRRTFSESFTQQCTPKSCDRKRECKGDCKPKCRCAEN
jgi:SH3 domain-containing YSC84-like protein 1